MSISKVYNSPSSLRSGKELGQVYNASQLETNRYYFSRLVGSSPIPTTPHETYGYLNALGLLISFTYPRDMGHDRYKVGERYVAEYNPYLAMFVFIRNSLNHPTRNKFEAIKQKIRVSQNRENRFDGVAADIKKYCMTFERLDYIKFYNFLISLFSNDKAFVPDTLFLRQKSNKPGRPKTYPQWAYDLIRENGPNPCREATDKELYDTYDYLLEAAVNGKFK